jgi:hypothetical protein
MSAERSPQPNDNDDTWYVNEQGRRVHITTLAGKRTRIIYPKDDFDLGTIPKWEAPESGRLAECPNCRYDTVASLEEYDLTPGVPKDQGAWRVLGRCGNCGWVGEGDFSQALCERYDKDLQKAYVDIGRAIVKSEMERLVDTFTMALDHDLISADDFGRPR